jgi:hypothetical protein
MSTSANSGCTDGECCTLHATGQGLPPAVLERIEIRAQIDPALDRCRDIIEKLWAPEDDGPREAAVHEDELPVLPCGVALRATAFDSPWRASTTPIESRSIPGTLSLAGCAARRKAASPPTIFAAAT